MEYLDLIVTRLSEKCVAVSPSGYSGPYTADMDTVTVDSDIITIDSE